MATDLSDVPAVVRRAWDSTIPPFVELSIVVGAAAHVLGLDQVLPALSGKLAIHAILPSAQAREALDFYGIRPLIPISAAVLLLGVAHATGLLTRALARLAPGQLIQNRTKMFFACTDPWYLRQLWHYHPNHRDGNGLNNLVALMEAEVERASQDANAYHALRAVRSARDQSSVHYSRGQFVKGVIVLVALLWLADPWILGEHPRPTNRLIFAAFLLSAALLIQMRAYISAELAYCRQRTSAYIEWKTVTAGPMPAQTAEASQQDDVAYQAYAKTLDNEVWVFQFWFRAGEEPGKYILRALTGVARRWVHFAASLSKRRRQNGRRTLK